MSNMATNLEQIVKLLNGYDYTFDCEDNLQAGVATVLDAGGIQYVREETIGTGNRIDFMLWQVKVGIEVKVKGSPMEVSRQLLRYARQKNLVQGLILVTSRMRHREVPASLAGIPIEVVCVAEGAL